MTPDRVRDALRLMALDGPGLGGLWLRARPGALRDGALDALAPLGPRRIGPQMSDEALSGGVDLTATLSAGRVVTRAGLLEADGLACLAGAERTPATLAARLAQRLDAGGLALVCVDEGAVSDEILPGSLADRMGVFLSLDGMRHDALGPIDIDISEGTRRRYAAMALTEDQARDLILAAAALGIPGLRAPLLAGRAARGLAALDGAEVVEEDHLLRATALCLSHRGTPPPDTEAEAERDAPSPDQSDDAGDRAAEANRPLPSEILVAAALAALPRDVLQSLTNGRKAPVARGTSGSGTPVRGHRRGRPLPARPGRPGDSARLDLVATLRAAAPWQTIRATGAPMPRLVHLRRADFRVKRFEQRTDRLLIFCVDASGSQAVSRLAEAKGAIELLLAQAYARRDHVSLIAFRGDRAELLLPPTRSLVQTKKRLAALPGGGGTPLAAGLSAAADLARLAARQGLTPTLALLTDGRANIDLAGQADRARAGMDALRVAEQVGATFPGGLVIDTGRRTSDALADIAARARARFLPLPRADAGRLSRAVAPLLAD